MKIHQVDVEQALDSLSSGTTGLSAAEARRRLQEYGPNAVEAVQREPLTLRLLREFIHLFALILWLAAALAFIAEWRAPGQGMATLGVAIIGVIVVNGMFSFWQEYRAERTLSALRRLLPHRVKVRRDGALTETLAEELVPGDVLLLGQGDTVPADCRLIAGFSLRINSATITGESMPHACHTAPSGEESVLHSRNVVLAGTSVVSGEGEAVVFATGMRTEFGTIAHLSQTETDVPSPLLLEIARMSRLVAMLAALLGVVFFFIGQWLGLPFWANFVFAIGIIVANVPEGLLPTVTLSLAMATQRMAKRNALVRHLPAVETLGAATVIVTDKTGTLTQNRMAVARLFAGGRERAPEDLTGSSPHFLEVARLCHNLQQIEQDGARVLVGDPMEIALADYGQARAGTAFSGERADEVPFDSDRKRLSTVHDTADGRVLYCKGAPETVLPLCEGIWLDGTQQPLSATQTAEIIAAQQAMARQGLRVLAFAYRDLPQDSPPEKWEQGLVFLGLVALEDPPRPEVPGAIRRCRTASIQLVMVTGDHPQTALAIAREIGLVQSDAPTVVSGTELARLSRTQLQLALDAPEIIFARVAADQKMHIVNALRRKGHVVAVTGDGVNDAPALRAGDIGIAMGISGTDVAKEAADMVLLDDNFATIVAAIEEGRAVYDNLRKFLTYILTSNIPELIPYLAFVLFRIPLPLTIIQILAVDLGTDLLPALALGAERADPAVMQRPPRPRSERLLSRALLARAYLWLGMLEAAAAMAAFFYVLQTKGWQGEMLAAHDPLYLQATSACLSTIIAMQVANVFLCRDPRRSIVQTGLLGNPLILAGIAAELLIILWVDYTRWGQALFGTAPLAADVWLFMLPMALAMIVLEEMRKWLARRAARGP